MKLHLAANEGLQLFSGYGTGYVSINSARYEHAVVVTPRAVSPWPVDSFEALTAADFAFIAQLKPEVVVLGTGARQRFPDARLLAALAATGVGVEVMDSRAACRTYNILAQEGRRVVLALLLEP